MQQTLTQWALLALKNPFRANFIKSMPYVSKFHGSSFDRLQLSHTAYPDGSIETINYLKNKKKCRKR